MPSRRLLVPLLAGALTCAWWAPPATALEFAPFPGSPVSVAQPTAVTAADVDLDGVRELAVADAAGNDFHLYEVDRDGAVVHVTDGYAGPAARLLGFADYTGIPALEAIAVNDNGLTMTGGFGNDFGNAVTYTLSPATHPDRMELRDLDGDGFDDLVVLDAAARQVRAFRFRKQTFDFELAGTVDTIAAPMDLALGDFDDDGNADVVVGGDDLGRVTVAFGDGSAGFGAPAMLLAPSGPFSVAAADVDEDGDDDVLAPQRGAAGIMLLRSNGDRSFAPVEEAVTVGNGPLELERGDLNGDGHVDLLTMPTFRGELALALGDGNGGFRRPLSNLRSLVGNPYPTLADLDGDGRDDIVLRYPGQGAVELWRNVTAPAAATTAPSLAGTPAVGERLSCDPGAWSGSDPLTVTVAWQRDGVAIAGATGESYTVTEEDRGTTVRCAVTGANELPAVTVATAGLAVPPPVGPPAGPDAPPASPDAPAPPRIDSAPAVRGRGRSVTLRFSGAPSFECRVDGAAWAACGSPLTLSGLRAGDHTVAVRGVGADGTRGAGATVAFEVNPYPPGVTLATTRLRAAGGLVPLRLSCSPREGEGRGACRGTVALRTVAAVPRTLGSASFQLTAGRGAVARVRLTARGRRALRAARGPLAIRVVVRARDLAGNAATVSRRATLR